MTEELWNVAASGCLPYIGGSIAGEEKIRGLLVVAKREGERLLVCCSCCRWWREFAVGGCARKWWFSGADLAGGLDGSCGGGVGGLTGFFFGYGWWLVGRRQVAVRKMNSVARVFLTVDNEYSI